MKRVDAFWDCQVIDRALVAIPPIQVRAPRALPEVKYAQIRDRWLDIDRQIDGFEAYAESCDWVGENFPRFWPNLGPEVCATAFGCELKFSENTSWSIPVVKDIRDVPAMKPNLDNFYWNHLRRFTAEAYRRGHGKWLTSVADLHTNTDLLASLRDPQNLALDYALDPEGVRQATEYVKPMFDLFYDDLYQILRDEPANCTWGMCIARGRMYYVSCDFICMISPKDFQETTLPCTAYECSRLERSIFHLDGPGALRHLDALLALKDLDGIQWTYGAGKGPARNWIDVYKRIQAAGKCMEIHIADNDDVKAIMENIRPNGVWMLMPRAMRRDEADSLIRDMERWAAGKK